MLVFLAACFAAGAGVSGFRRWSSGRARPEAYSVVVDSAAAAAEEAESGPLDLNTASAAALEGLPGIGPVLAGRILDYRVRNGLFRAESELLNVPGIGQKRYSALRGLVAVGRDSS